MINKMEWVKNIGLMDLFIEDNIKMGLRMVKENLNGKMITYIRVILLKIEWKEKDYTNGSVKVNNLKGIGRII